MDELCARGRAEVPVYEIARNGRHGTQVLDLGGGELFVAEGIFAHEIVADAVASRQLLAAAYCVTQQPLVTFGRRLTRDLRERRKPPLVLVRRGLALMRDQGDVVERARRAGCDVVSSDEAFRRLQEMTK